MSTWTGPLKQTGALDGYKQKLMTACLGSEFSDIDLVDVLRAPNSDAILRDMAIMSQSLFLCCGLCQRSHI